MFSARNGASLDFLWLRVMTCQGDFIFLRKNEVSIYTFKCSGIMENWIKHELFHLNNEISWWHDMTHDNMSSLEIRHMTSRHDFIGIKFDILLFLYVAVSELERWFYFCFALYLGREIHSNYRRLRDLHAWPWNWMSRHGLRDICHFCLYLCYRKDFFCFVTFLGQGIHSNYCHPRDIYVWPWNSRSRHGLRDICYFWPLVCVIPQWFFVLSGSQIKEFILTIATCVTITCDLET